MESLINLIDGSTAKILLVVFVSFALWVIGEFRSSINKTMDSHRETINQNSKSFTNDMRELKMSLAQHTNDMNKTVKEINSQSLRLREDLAEKSVDFNNGLNETKIGIVKINRSLMVLGTNVTEYRKALEDGHGRVLSIEKNQIINRETIIKTKGMVESIKEEYGRVRVVAEKSKQSAEEAKKIAEGHDKTVKKVEAIFARQKKEKS